MGTGSQKACDPTICAQTAAPADPGSDGRQQVDASTALVAQLLALGQDCAAHIADPWLTVDHGTLLYDDKGLPR